MAKDNETEEKILIAARLEFQEKGLAGARMQAIADRAEVNKGLLHYYFKNKDSLFNAIFSKAIRQLMAEIFPILESKLPDYEKFQRLAERYTEHISKNPELPKFVLGEISKNPQEFFQRFLPENAKGAARKMLDNQQSEQAGQEISVVDKQHYFLDLISMVLLPYIARPLIEFFFALEGNEFNQIMSERKTHIQTVMTKIMK